DGHRDVDVAETHSRWRERVGRPERAEEAVSDVDDPRIRAGDECVRPVRVEGVGTRNRDGRIAGIGQKDAQQARRWKRPYCRPQHWSVRAYTTGLAVNRNIRSEIQLVAVGESVAGQEVPVCVRQRRDLPRWDDDPSGESATMSSEAHALACVAE